MEWEKTRAYFASCLPHEAKDALWQLKEGQLREIRIRTGQQAELVTHKGRVLLPWQPTDRQLEQVCEALCEHALYARSEEMCKGFVTLRGGHRLGLCGRALCRGNTVRALRDISSICLRVAGQWPGVANSLMDHVITPQGLLSVLVIGGPGMGKTTLLRDLCRQVSQAGYQIAMADERGELAACYQGVPQLDIGPHTDVLDGCAKGEALSWLLRAMSPQMLFTDELDGLKEAEHVLEAAMSGVAVAASAHGLSLKQVAARPGLDPLIKQKVFGLYAVLKGPGQGFTLYDEEGAPCQ